jgi:glutathione synthase/RimK-type ligase-like ATP-grasp enzyme
VDDRPLFDAIAARGAAPVAAVWDDPSVDWKRFDAVLIRTTWDYMEKREAFVAWAQRVEAQTRLFNCSRIVQWNTSKTYLRDLKQRGVPIPPTVWLRQGPRVDVAAIMQHRGWTAGMIKPVIGATARETHRFNADVPGILAAQKHLDRLLQHEAMMLQPYFSRVETEGERSAIFIDGRFSHAVQKIPRAGDYRVQDDFGAKDHLVSLDAAELQLTRDVLACVDVDLLYARVDMLRDNQGWPVLTELELVEPSLFFRHNREAAHALAKGLLRRIAATGRAQTQAARSGGSAQAP